MKSGREAFTSVRSPCTSTDIGTTAWLLKPWELFRAWMLTSFSLRLRYGNADLALGLQTVDRARRAEKRCTTLDALVEDYLVQLAKTEERARSEATGHLLRTLRELTRPMGGKPWKDRDELYEG